MNADVLDATRAATLAGLALAAVGREFPGRSDHTHAGPGEDVEPRVLHPAFHGSYDWHSCVHMCWTLAVLRRRLPALPCRGAIDALFDARLTTANVAAECAYLRRPHALAFERPYGWAWLLQLAGELALVDGGGRWAAALAPLVDLIVERFAAWLPRARYPNRQGTHANTAFALAFALDHARRADRGDFAARIEATARAWYAADRAAPWQWEPSGADFLSPVLVEAVLMARLLPTAAFAGWLDGFLPAPAFADGSVLATPVVVADRSDPQIVHLDGLNLSRAWCWREIAAALPAGDARAGPALAAARHHLEAGLAGLRSEDFVGAHWLASYALLAHVGAGGGGAV